MIELHSIDVFVQIFVMVPSSFIMNSRNMKKKSNFIIFKAMKSTSKSRFGHYLLSSILNDKF